MTVHVLTDLLPPAGISYYVAPRLRRSLTISVLADAGDHVLRNNPPSVARVVLAYVLAPEITRVMEPTAAHSREAVMKAWECSDYGRMGFAGLAIAPEDKAELE